MINISLPGRWTGKIDIQDSDAVMPDELDALADLRNIAHTIPVNEFLQRVLAF